MASLAAEVLNLTAIIRLELRGRYDSVCDRAEAALDDALRRWPTPEGRTLLDRIAAMDDNDWCAARAFAHAHERGTLIAWQLAGEEWSHRWVDPSLDWQPILVGFDLPCLTCSCSCGHPQCVACAVRAGAMSSPY